VRRSDPNRPVSVNQQEPQAHFPAAFWSLPDFLSFSFQNFRCQVIAIRPQNFHFPRFDLEFLFRLNISTTQR
jgi:hypothetical protein